MPLRDETLQSIVRRSRTHGPAARRILDERIGVVRAQTHTLRDLTARIEGQNEELRQQVRANDEDSALAELRRLYG